jgi:Flp pilus assembly protein TadG
MIRNFTARLRANQRGTTLMEFAFVAPTLTLLLLATFDFSYGQYVGSVLQGEVQKSGRDAALEGSTSALASLDGRVRTRVNTLVESATYTITRKNVASFERAGQAEPFLDAVHGSKPLDGICNQGEAYTDENNNGSFDTSATAGSDGQGGARDITVYTVKVSYPRLFPLNGLLGLPTTVTQTATTVLRNQPFGQQATRIPGTGTCT